MATWSNSWELASESRRIKSGASYYTRETSGVFPTYFMGFLGFSINAMSDKLMESPKVLESYSTLWFSNNQNIYVFQTLLWLEFVYDSRLSLAFKDLFLKNRKDCHMINTFHEFLPWAWDALPSVLIRRHNMF